MLHLLKGITNINPLQNPSIIQQDTDAKYGTKFPEQIFHRNVDIYQKQKWKTNYSQYLNLFNVYSNFNYRNHDNTICINNSEAKFAHCFFYNLRNVSVIIKNSPNTIFENCIFNGNNISCIITESSSVKFRNCLFRNDKKISIITSSNSISDIKNCSFVDVHGKAILVKENSKLILNDTTIINSKKTVIQIHNSKIQSENLKIQKNHSKSILIQNSEGYFSNCQLSGTIAIFQKKSNPVFYKCNFINNNNMWNKSLVICKHQCRPFFYDCSFEDQTNIFTILELASPHFKKCDFRKICFNILNASKVTAFKLNTDKLNENDQKLNITDIANAYNHHLNNSEVKLPVCSLCNVCYNDDIHRHFYVHPFGATLCKDCYHKLKFYPICIKPNLRESRQYIHELILYYNSHCFSVKLFKYLKEILHHLSSDELRIQVEMLSDYFYDSNYFRNFIRIKKTKFDYYKQFRELYIRILTEKRIIFDRNKPVSFQSLYFDNIWETAEKYIIFQTIEYEFIDWLFDVAEYDLCEFRFACLFNFFTSEEASFDEIPLDFFKRHFYFFKEHFMFFIKMKEFDTYSHLCKSAFISFILPELIENRCYRKKIQNYILNEIVEYSKEDECISKFFSGCNMYDIDDINIKIKNVVFTDHIISYSNDFY